jgi:hypothetical protein
LTATENFVHGGNATWHLAVTAWQNVSPFWLYTFFAEYSKKKQLWDWTA